ncbi:hypothetical protein GX50_00745 [[Emmonsia] crescens]|uniref:Uncharacterized protein n=1 Tax=[Emmonsia] crescens TaxID=73230 RepID=A0A2B7ZTA0_9EURO|nr:hypothetical protein GX50_00745 [Emmonsia crescens]
MKLNLLLVCLISGLTPIFGAPEMEKKAATNSLDTSPATKDNGGVLADDASGCAGVITAVIHARTASMLQVVVGVPRSWETLPTAISGESSDAEMILWDVADVGFVVSWAAKC